MSCGAWHCSELPPTHVGYALLQIALVLIDEVHLLNENRGSTLEAGVISRIKMVSRMPTMRVHPIAAVRYVAVSATIPNLRDIADWLGAPPMGIKCFGKQLPLQIITVIPCLESCTRCASRAYSEGFLCHQACMPQHLSPLMPL